MPPFTFFGVKMQKTQINNIDHDDQIILFFNALFGENAPDAILNICLKTKDKGLMTSSFKATDREQVIEMVKELRDQGELYYEVCQQNNFPEQGKRGKVADKTVMFCLWMDIDIAGPNHVADEYPKTREDAGGRHVKGLC